MSAFKCNPWVIAGILIFVRTIYLLVVIMFDWKILAASFAALLVVSSVLVGGFGFPDILDKLNELMGDSPLGGFVSAPIRPTKDVSVIFEPDYFEFSVNSASFEAGDSEFTGFSGSIQANLSSNILAFLPDDSGFRLTRPVSEFTIDGVKISRISYEDTSFHVISDALDTSGQNASLEIIDFSGKIGISRSGIRLDGNVTTVKGNGKDIV
jgi:hypothetical protein